MPFNFKQSWDLPCLVIVLAENTQMLSLGRKLGFKVRLIPGSGL